MYIGTNDTIANESAEGFGVVAGGGLTVEDEKGGCNHSVHTWIESRHVSSYLLWISASVAIVVGVWALRILSRSDSISDRIAYSQSVVLCIYIGLCLVDEIPWLRQEAWANVYCYFDASVKISTMTYLHGTESLIALSRCLDVVKAVFMRRFNKNTVFWCCFSAVCLMAVSKTAIQLLWTTPPPGICMSEVKYHPGWDLVIFLVISGVSYGYMIVYVFLRCEYMRVRMRINLVSVAATLVVHVFVDSVFALTLLYLTDKSFLDVETSFILIIVVSSLIPVSYVVISTLPRARAKEDLSHCVGILRCDECSSRRTEGADFALATICRAENGEPAGDEAGGVEAAHKARPQDAVDVSDSFKNSNDSEMPVCPDVHDPGLGEMNRL